MRTEVLGCPVDVVDADGAVLRLRAQIDAFRERSTTSLSVVTLGTEMVVRAQSDEEFRALLQRAGLVLCDTIGVWFASRIPQRGRPTHPLPERVTGVSLVERLAADCAQRGGALYLLGGRGDTASLAAKRLVDRYPGLTVAGVRDGYFAAEESEEIAATIAASGAEVLLCALGSPRQERWIDRHLARTGCAIGIGVGGAFDVFSGRTTRAPEWMQAIGWEWLYRLLKEPQRWRRQLALPHFVWLIVRDILVTSDARSPHR